MLPVVFFCLSLPAPSATQLATGFALEVGMWYMTKTTFMKFIGMVDNDGQPIARVNYGLNGKVDRFLLGRAVVCNDYM